MAKRKAVVETKKEDLDLSPPPAGLLGDDTAVNGTLTKRGTPNRTSLKRKSIVEETADADPTPKSSKKRKVNVEMKEEEIAGTHVNGNSKKTAKAKRQRKPTQEDEAVHAGVNDDPPKKNVKRRRKTEEEKLAEAMPLAPRTVGHNLFIGAHVSGAGGVHNSVLNSVHIGANAFALFLKSQRKWVNPPLVDDHCTSFHDSCKSHSYDQTAHVVPHGSYLVNLAHTDKDRTTQAYDSFLDDLKRCEKLGIKLYNFHPGVANSTGGDRQAAIAHLASNLNRAHKETPTVVTLLENMAAGGNVLGSTFEDLRDIIALVKDKRRVGVCLDACHAFAAGYDLRTPEAFKETMGLFEATVGFNYMRALHMNDSKAPFASKKDLHANIGTGFLGLRSFHNIVNEARFRGLPMILETPLEVRDDNGVLVKDEKGKEQEDKGIWAREIKLLESLVGMDTSSEEFLKLERDLARKGEPERQRLSDQIERTREKEEKKVKSAKKKDLKARGERKGDGDDGGIGTIVAAFAKPPKTKVQKEIAVKDNQAKDGKEEDDAGDDDSDD